MTERVRICLDASVAAIIGPEGARLLVGSQITFRSGSEVIPAHVEEAGFGEDVLQVLLVLDEPAPPGMAYLPGQKAEVRDVRVGSSEHGGPPGDRDRAHVSGPAGCP